MSWRNSQNNWKHYEEEALRAAVLSYENDNGKGQKNWNSIRDDAKVIICYESDLLQIKSKSKKFTIIKRLLLIYLAS